MKLLLFVFLFIASKNTYSQVELKTNCFKLQGKDVEDCVSKIVAVAGNYKLFKIDSSRSRTIFVYSNLEKDELQIHFSTFLIDADPDLKKPGTKAYSLSTIFGQFMTIEKVYSAFLGRQINLASVKVEGSDKFEAKYQDKTHTIDLSRYDNTSGYWLIRIF